MAGRHSLPALSAGAAAMAMPGDEATTTEDARGAPLPPGASLPPGLRIGAYRVVRELGRGGMGAVYLAQRADEAFEKQVAIKVISPGTSSDQVLARFMRERRILARLEHPHIARLIDGGSTADGLPYFVMEYVEGQRILDYCDQRRLPVAERLKLFLAVCSAVAHAHRNLIVHRDIKPGNILVTAQGEPSLLDFGIAKLIESGDPDALQATAVAFTPRYASPEQIRGEPLTTATDVYSLGVLLYELLTGQVPYRLKGLQPLELMKAIVEQEAETPSAALERTLERTLPAAAPSDPPVSAASRLGEGSAEALRKRLRGDLDAILMMALRKEPQRRYPSVDAFAADVGRYLEGRPVGARRGSLAYRSRKFLRRHRWGAAAAAAAVALLAASGANVVVQSRRVARERDRAERISRFLMDLFAVSDPGEARGNTITAREVLDKGVAQIAGDLKEQPAVRADLMDTMGQVYDRLGLYEKAAELLRESLALRRRSAGAEPAALARTLNELGNVLLDKGEGAAAEPLYRESLELRRRLFGNQSKEVAESLNNLASVVSDQLAQYDEAERLFTESLAIKRALLGAESVAAATTLGNIAIVRYKKGDRAGAQVRFRDALAIQRKVLGDDHPSVAGTLANIGVVQEESGDSAAAEQTYREVLAIQRKVLGAEHPDIAATVSNLANAVNHARRPQDAEPLYREAIALNSKFFGADSSDVAGNLVGLAEVERQRGRIDEAETLLRRSAAIRERKLGPQHPELAESLTPLAKTLGQRHKLAEAEAVARRALAICEAKLLAGHPALADAQLALGVALAEQGRFADAEATLLRAWQGLTPQAPPSLRREAVEALVQLYQGWGKSDEAARFKALLAATS
jgi:serine/threonine-protein kinase